MTSRKPIQPADEGEEFLRVRADAIRTLGKRAAHDIIEIGKLLTECKAKLGHGQWLPWLKRELGWSERAAQRFMEVHDFARTKSANLADLTIDVSALYLLAAKSTPDTVRTEMLERAEKGETITHKMLADARGRFPRPVTVDSNPSPPMRFVSIVNTDPPPPPIVTGADLHLSHCRTVVRELAAVAMRLRAGPKPVADLIEQAREKLDRHIAKLEASRSVGGPAARRH